MKIVGIGASAGGLKALEEFFAHLPNNLGLVYVVVQHLSPKHTSSLPEILGRCTDMPVIALRSGLVPEPDHVYIKPPDQDVEVLNGALHLTDRRLNSNRLNLPIDSFFASLAEDQREAGVGIVLSGTGSDGSRGLRDIKEKGGLVMVQSPESATFDGMPNAVIRLHICDLILPAEELAARLAYISRHERRLRDASPELAQLSNNQILGQVLTRIEQNTRLDFTKYRESTIRRRLEKRMLIQQKNTLREYAQLALNDPEELDQLQQSFLIGVTRFFRDEEVYDLLRTEVLPNILDRLAPGDPVRIWVPACSTGEEAYSIGMIAQEVLDERHDKRELKIFASDVDTQAIQIATRGQYDRAISADVPIHLLQTYFKLEKNYYRVVPALREKILFAVQNLLVDPPFINIDLVSCRNFLIYIKSKTQHRIITNFHFALKPEAFLLLGPSENIGSLNRAFTTINRRWNIFQKKEHAETHVEHALRIRLPAQVLSSQLPVSSSAAPVTPSSSLGGNTTAIPDSAIQDAFAQLLSERYAPPSIFVTRNYEIVYLNGELEGLLHLPKFHARFQLQNVLDEEMRTLFQAGVDAVLQTGKTGVLKEVNISGDPDQPRSAKIHFSPVYIASHDHPLALIEIHFLGEENSAQAPEDSSGTHVPNDMLHKQIQTLERELKEVKQLLESYKDAIEKSERQGGLIDMKGNIVHLNRTRQPDMTVDDYLQQKIYDFLSETGRELYDSALERIKQGSFREVVRYEAKDLRFSNEPVSVEYQPIISNGEIIFINVHEISAEE